ncbi:MAG: radical SAM protein [Elusimicrobiota bacterium]
MPLDWYGRKAESLLRPLGLAKKPVGKPRAAALPGIRGSMEHRTLFTRSLPPGCRGCLQGKGTNLLVTGLCTRDCAFCFNEKPRRDETVVHGFQVAKPEEAAEIVRRYGLRSVGMSGGEPLLFPERVERLARALKALPFRVWIDVYSNGDKATPEVLGRLRDAGVDSMRFNLAANGYDTAPVELAVRFFKNVAVELPAIPADMEKLKAMVLRLDSLGVPYLNIHELFVCRENQDRLSGFASTGESPKHLLWEPAAGADEACLELLRFALKNTKTLSVYYCSCRTQELISKRGLARRKRCRR